MKVWIAEDELWPHYSISKEHKPWCLGREFYIDPTLHDRYEAAAKEFEEVQELLRGIYCKD